MVGRRKKLSPEQQAELRERYRVFLANRPKSLMRDYGITTGTLMAYVYCKHKGRA